MNIRTASNTDADILASLVFSSGENSLNAMFNWGESHTPVNFLRASLREPLGQFGYEHHVVVACGDDVAGVGCCWTHETTSGFRQATMESLVSYFGHERTLWVLERSQLIAELIPGPGPDELVLGHIAVAETHRRTGCAGQLIAYFAEKARALKKTSLVLDVETSNSAAISLYQKHGFSIESSRTPSEKGQEQGLTPHHHMVRLL